MLGVNAWCGIHTWRLVREQAVIKEDYAQVNSIRNGLLSVEVWKAHLKKIASKKIAHFDFSPEQEEAVRGAVEKGLDALIGEMNKMMRKPQKTFRGKVRKLAFKVFIDTQSLTENTSEYAQAVIDEVKKPANLEKIKDLALSQIKDPYAAEGAVDVSSLKALLAKYKATGVEDFNTHAGELILSFLNKIQTSVSVMMGSLCLFLLAWWGARQRRDLYKPLYAVSVALAFILLFSALALPMIDIDARIKNVDFVLTGEHLQFTNQLLFYRSKSIMQMVTILITAGKADTAVVGFLIFLFSIAFPIAKLFSALLCLYGGPKLRNHKVVSFFAYQSGKWSMADVMVVAIFMAYIGFNGVLNGQLKNLNFSSPSAGVITTNETALQPGYLLFLAFVLYSLALSAILKKIVPEDEDK